MNAVTASVERKLRLDALNAACLSIIGADDRYNTAAEILARAERFRAYLAADDAS